MRTRLFRDKAGGIMVCDSPENSKVYEEKNDSSLPKGELLATFASDPKLENVMLTAHANHIKIHSIAWFNYEILTDILATINNPQ